MMIVLEEEEGERVGQDTPRGGDEAGPDPQDLELMKLLTSEVEQQQQQQQQCGGEDDDRVDGDGIGLSIGRFYELKSYDEARIRVISFATSKTCYFISPSCTYIYTDLHTYT